MEDVKMPQAEIFIHVNMYFYVSSVCQVRRVYKIEFDS